MKKFVTSFALCFFLIAGAVQLAAQSAHQGNTQQESSQRDMTKEELADAIAHAHRLVNIYAFRYARRGASERDYRAYLFWLDRREELVKQYREMR